MTFRELIDQNVITHEEYVSLVNTYDGEAWYAEPDGTPEDTAWTAYKKIVEAVLGKKVDFDEKTTYLLQYKAAPLDLPKGDTLSEVMYNLNNLDTENESNNAAIDNLSAELSVEIRRNS